MMTSFLEVQPSDPTLVRYAKQNTTQMGLLAGCLAVVVLIQLFGDRKRKTKLARGHLAKGTERGNALKLMKQQQAGQKLTKTAFKYSKTGPEGFSGGAQCPAGCSGDGFPWCG